MNDHKLFTLRPEVVQCLLDNGHLSAFRRFIHNHMLPSFQQIAKDITIHFSTDKGLAGHILVIYKRLIHNERF